MGTPWSPYGDLDRRGKSPHDTDRRNRMHRRQLAMAIAAFCVATPIFAQQSAQQHGAAVEIADNTPRFLSTPTKDAPAVDVSGAPALQRRVELEFDRIPLRAALAVIERQTGLHFVATGRWVPLDELVSMSASHLTVGAALFELLSGKGVNVQLGRDGTTLALIQRESIRTAVRQRQGGGTIAGRVTDAITHAPLDQVAVGVDGPGIGAVTTADGRYTVRNVLPGTYRVTARRVGYAPRTQVVMVATDSTAGADFGLTAAATKLNEVVTTAVGDQRRYEVGNVISTINADSIAPTAPITSLTDLISARAPGVTVEETGGLTGSGEAIRIRGQASLVLQGDPILIVDGVRQDNRPGGMALPHPPYINNATPAPSRLNDINFDDIESINVLKGPAASTEYGTDAANGVIVITTKHGVSGRPQWHAALEQTASAIPRRFAPLFYSWGHTTDASHSAAQCPLVASAQGSGFGSTTGTCVVDSITTWNPLNHPFYSIFGAGYRQKYDLSVSGGSDATRYFVAGTVSNESGVLHMPGVFVPQAAALGVPRSAFDPNSQDQRSLRANTATRLGPTADLTVSGAYLSTFQQTPKATGLLTGVAANLPLRDSTNGYGYGLGGFLAPIRMFGQPTSQATNRVTGGLTANWRPAPWLVGHATAGIDHGSERATTAVLPQVAPLYPFDQAQLGIENATTDIYTVDTRGSATAALTPAVRSVTSIGVQLADTRTQGTTALAQGVTASNFTLNGSPNPTISQLGDRQATLGVYGEEQVGISNRLFLTGALRIDAGSGFGRDYSTAIYPKASLSWLLINSGSTTLRARSAFGASGVQPPNGAALQLYAATTDWYNASVIPSVKISNVQNRVLQPERSVEYEGGFDLGAWHDRLSVDLTVYSKTTQHALVNLGTGWDAGALPYTVNVGTVRNDGLEGTVTAMVLQSRALTWDMTVNASLNRNKLVTLAPGAAAQQFNGSASQSRFAPGYPLYGYWGPEVRYADLNHDGLIEASEITVAPSLTYAGPSLPTREASWGTHMALGSNAVSVSALLDYRGGLRVANTLGYFASSTQTDAGSNKRGTPLWQQARDVGTEQIQDRGLDGFAMNNGFYEDGSYVRFRELSLTYQMPDQVARALRTRLISLTGAVRNLALWTPYTGADPEVANADGFNVQVNPTSNRASVNNNLREDSGAVPLARYFVVRLNVGF